MLPKVLGGEVAILKIFFEETKASWSHCSDITGRTGHGSTSAALAEHNAVACAWRKNPIPAACEQLGLFFVFFLSFHHGLANPIPDLFLFVSTKFYVLPKGLSRLGHPLYSLEEQRLDRLIHHTPRIVTAI